MKKLILIRHGETNYTSQGKYCGHEDIPLNAKGIAQAKGLGDKVKSIKIERIYASDLKRAFQTAEIAFSGKAICKRKGLREIDFGEFSGLAYDEVSRLYPDIYKRWMDNPADVRIPGGEYVRDFAKRIEKCFSNINKRNLNKTVALVIHGGPIRVILLKLLKLDLGKFWEIGVETAAVNIIDFSEGVASPWPSAGTRNDGLRK